MKINRRFLDEIAKRLDAVSASGRSAIEQIMINAPQTYNFDELFSYVAANYMPIVEACADNAAAIGANAYDTFRELETGRKLGALPYTAFNADGTRDALVSFVGHACNTGDMALLASDLGRRLDSEVIRSYANTETANGASDPFKPRFARVPSGINTCDFCRALAGHGFFYTTAEAAGDRGGKFNTFHDFCRCQVVPQFSRQAKKLEVEGYDPTVYRDEWRETRQQFGGTTKIRPVRKEKAPEIDKPLLTSPPPPAKLPAKAYGGAWNQKEDMDTFLKSVFDKDDYVGTCSEFYTTRDGRRAPTKGLFQRRAGQIENVLDRTNNVSAAVGKYRRQDGAYVRINPLDGRGISDENVINFKYALIESDTIPLEDQYGFIKALNLPTQAIVTSGGKSVHALVRVDARNIDEYRERVSMLHAECKAAGFDVDSATKNPSRYMRIPGVKRGDSRQVLVSTGEGAKDWDSWREWCASRRR